jgi:eukaryotic-like serine/threonine-protein kinase
VTLPQTLGRLRQVKPLGSGGFAEVWLYHDPDLDSPVAVKVLSAQWTQAVDIRERFLQEAR